MSYRFAARPRWIVLHVLVLFMVSLFAVAGFWQLHRLHERKEHNAEIDRAVRGKPILLTPSVRVPAEASAARTSGRYDTAHELRLVNRSLDEEAGDHLVTPLLIDKEHAVLVDRGWVPPGGKARAVSGRVTVNGIFFTGAEPKRPLAPDNPKTGTLKQIVRIDPSRIGKQLPYTILDGFVQLAKQTPAPTGILPKIVPPPDLGDGPHLAYAVQWFLFIPTALAVYVAMLRRERKKLSDSVPA